MRRLIIAALTTLILLSPPLSTPQGRGLQSVCRPTLTINLSRFRALPAQAPTGERGLAQSVQESITLEHGKPIERELSGGQLHSYKITMTAGQYLQVEAKQNEIDVAMAGDARAERLSASAALRQAQMSIWKQKQWRAPYYWAAFVLHGEWK